MDFSVIIATHNNLEILKRCLTCWEKHASGQAVEVLVVEDGCQDGTAAFLAEQAQTDWGRRHLRWFHEDDVNELLCDNRGLAEARGEYCLIWHDDMYLQVPWLLADLKLNLDAYPEIGLVALSRGLLLHEVEKPFETWSEMLAPARNESTIGPRFWNWWKWQGIDGVVRPWVLRRRAWEQVGSLDPLFCPNEWDESDLCFRLRQKGWETATYGYERLGAYHHLLSSTMSRLPSERLQGVALANGRKFYERWGETIRQTARRPRRRWWKRWSPGAAASAFAQAWRRLFSRRT